MARKLFQLPAVAGVDAKLVAEDGVVIGVIIGSGSQPDGATVPAAMIDDMLEASEKVASMRRFRVPLEAAKKVIRELRGEGTGT